ncbi:response regulator transcription factor [bacterium]|nr:response regulator transcription factor [bacterium]MBT3853507.1 response regulator transcription factor [bacterium]MBT4351875.1 response regulator transcription factor [archaeon]MBT4632881.1 response regulator transcription factor [bacterium]MBT6778765.1 response regulator transcription factor [bacterium]
MYARIRSLLRKKHEVINTILTINDDIIYDTTNRLFIKNNCILNLTAREVKLAEYFIFNI